MKLLISHSEIKYQGLVRQENVAMTKAFLVGRTDSYMCIFNFRGFNVCTYARFVCSGEKKQIFSCEFKVCR